MNWIVISCILFVVAVGVTIFAIMLYKQNVAQENMYVSLQKQFEEYKTDSLRRVTEISRYNQELVDKVNMLKNEHKYNVYTPQFKTERIKQVVRIIEKLSEKQLSDLIDEILSREAY